MRKETVGDRVTLALKNSGMDDADIAREANRLMGGDEGNKIITASWISAVKNDHIKNPPLDKLAALAKACGVKLSELTEPMGVIPIEELETSGWQIRMRRDGRLPNGIKDAIDDLVKPGENLNPPPVKED